MANRRMFARTVTNSGRFLRLSGQSRLLYYDLGMEADDDGFVEAYVRLTITGSGEENLAELEKAGFIRICDRENLVVYILDWQKNNLIRADRYTPSIYKELYLPEPQQKPETVVQVLNSETQQKPEASIQVLNEETQQKPEAIIQVLNEETQQKPEQKSEPVPSPSESEAMCEETVHQAEPMGQPEGAFLGDSRLTQVSLGKVSIGKGRLEEGSSEEVNSNQIKKDEFNIDKNRIEPKAAEKETFDADKSAPPQLEETDMDFEEKRRECLRKLLNSEYFQNTRAAPGKPCPV